MWHARGAVVQTARADHHFASEAPTLDDLLNRIDATGLELVQARSSLMDLEPDLVYDLYRVDRAELILRIEKLQEAVGKLRKQAEQASATGSCWAELSELRHKCKLVLGDCLALLLGPLAREGPRSGFLRDRR